MCKKNRNAKIRQKTLAELTDGEYLERVEEVGVPFYVDYLTAPRFSDVSINGYLSRTDIGILANNAKIGVPIPDPASKGPKGKVYDKRRWFASFLVLFMSLVLVAAAVIGWLKPASIEKYVVTINGTGIGMCDPVVACIDYFCNLGLGGEFVNFLNVGTGEELIVIYVWIALTAIYTICTLIMLIKSLGALFQKRKRNGYYAKYHFGALGLVMLICALGIIACGLYKYGNGISEILSFVTPCAEPGVGYVLYGMVAIPILMMICSGAMYRRVK